MPFPATLDADPRIIFFTDFDGTISDLDSNDTITTECGFGATRLAEVTKQIANGTVSFRDGFLEEFSSWQLPLPQVLERMKFRVGVDPHFPVFMRWAKSHGVPVVIISSGLKPLLQPLLENLIGPELAADIEIVSNDAQLKEPVNSFDKPDGWTIKFHDDSAFGHDKSLEIRKYADAVAQYPADRRRPTLLYAGDGVSDLSAARETNLLFAKAGKDLVSYCEKERIPFTTFESWESILAETKEIFEGRKTVGNVASEGLRRHRTNSVDKVAERKS